MNNLGAIQKMDLVKMETFLDHVYLTGLNKGLHAATLDEEAQEQLLQGTPYDESWLLSDAEDATALVFSDDGDTFIPSPLAQAIMEIAGIALEVNSCGDNTRRVKISFQNSLDGSNFDLEEMDLPELYELLAKLENQMSILQADEPEDEDSDEYEDWEDAVDELEDQISDVEDAISERADG